MPIPVHALRYYVIAAFATGPGDTAKHFSNTFFFAWDGTGTPTHDAAADAIKVILDKFYGQVNSPGTSSIASYLSGIISVANSAYKIYQLADSPPRVPESRSMSIGTVSGAGLPNEVSAVISYRSDTGGAGGGTLNKRRRGRLYIGPLEQSVVGINDAGTDQELATVVTNALAGGADYLRDQTDNDMTWVQYSRVDDAFNNVTGGFVDDAYDTQRRRGAPPGHRTIW